MSGYYITHHSQIDGSGLPRVNLGQYDVVRGIDGKTMNDSPLSARAAERLLSKLPRVDESSPNKENVRFVMANQNIKWKKIGRGTFRTRSGKIIKPGQMFEASPEEIPEGFRDVIVPAEPLPEEIQIEVIPPSYEVKSVAPGWYDVIDSQGKVVNEKRLRYPEAEALVRRLKQ